MQLQDYWLQVQELVHDLSGVDFTNAELTNYVNAGRKRTALDLHCVRKLFQNANVVAQTEQYAIRGSVLGAGGPSVPFGTGGNQGYSTSAPPAVTIGAPPAGGVQATANAVLATVGSVTGVTGITMTNWGSGYSSVPAVSVPFGTGIGTITFNPFISLTAFDVSEITLVNGNLRYTMNWLPWRAFQAYMRAYINYTRPPAVWSLPEDLNLLFTQPIPDQNYPIDITLTVLPDDLVNATDVDTQVLPPNDDCVQYYAAHKALLKLQNFQQAEYYADKYEKRMLRINATKRNTRMINTYRTWYRRMARF